MLGARKRKNRQSNSLPAEITSIGGVSVGRDAFAEINLSAVANAAESINRRNERGGAMLCGEAV